MTTMAPTTCRARRPFAELPTDVLFAILLLLLAKELCCLHVDCHASRSLTCDPHFIHAHAAWHQRDPLLVVSFLSGPLKERTMLIDLIDQLGKTVKRVASAMDRRQVLCPRLGLVFVANKSDNTCCVLDPAVVDAGLPVAPHYRLPMLPAPPA